MPASITARERKGGVSAGLLARRRDWRRTGLDALVRPVGQVRERPARVHQHVLAKTRGEVSDRARTPFHRWAALT